MKYETKIDSITGQTHTGSGNIIVNNFGLAYQALKEALPENDPALRGLVESLKSLAAYHECINEWKELHNLLQELHNSVGQFYGRVERQYYHSSTSGMEDIRTSWHPCKRNIGMLVRFAKRIQHIWTPPYREENGILYGPPWVVEIVGKQRNLEEMLRSDNCDIGDLNDLTGEFSHDCDWHLYEADKNLHKEAGELYQLSTRILEKLTE